MELVDTHCHLDLFPSPQDVAAECQKHTIQTIAVTNAPSVFFFTRDLAVGRACIHPAVGLHPELVHSHQGELQLLLETLPTTRFVGEVGLDYVTKDAEVRRMQRQVFSTTLSRCADLKGRVITIHSRRSASDVISMIGTGYPGTVILHWFSGNAKELRSAIHAGAYFSVNPQMMLSESGVRLVREMPPERVLTETDGPFVNVDGRPATPLRVADVIVGLARLWSVEAESAAATVRRNLDRATAEP
jgi:TatD DNase family protein